MVVSLPYSRKPWPRRRAPPPDPSLEPVYQDDDLPEEERVLCGFIQLRPAEPPAGYSGGYCGGWNIYKTNRRLDTFADTRGEAIAMLRAKYLNRKVAADFHEKFNES